MKKFVLSLIEVSLCCMLIGSFVIPVETTTKYQYSHSVSEVNEDDVTNYKTVSDSPNESEQFVRKLLLNKNKNQSNLGLYVTEQPLQLDSSEIIKYQNKMYTLEVNERKIENYGQFSYKFVRLLIGTALVINLYFLQLKLDQS